ncbi:MAG: hypothetical protein HC884_01635 [Chloroflexaceae bacterium]|nr:hypothetical protein [Chloroflexaceae bacterium]
MRVSAWGYRSGSHGTRGGYALSGALFLYHQETETRTNRWPATAVTGALVVLRLQVFSI